MFPSIAKFNNKIHLGTWTKLLDGRMEYAHSQNIPNAAGNSSHFISLHW